MGGGGWVATYEDVTEHRHAEARNCNPWRIMMSSTSLPNRVLFRDQMAVMLGEPVRDFERLAVLCLDLNSFKNVNDTLGHPAGDALLRLVAKRLRKCVRADDVVARLGGDEFAILQRSAGRPGPGGTAGAAYRRNRWPAV